MYSTTSRDVTVNPSPVFFSWSAGSDAPYDLSNVQTIADIDYADMFAMTSLEGEVGSNLQQSMAEFYRKSMEQYPTDARIRSHTWPDRPSHVDATPHQAMPGDVEMNFGQLDYHFASNDAELQQIGCDGGAARNGYPTWSTGITIDREPSEIKYSNPQVQVQTKISVETSCSSSSKRNAWGSLSYAELIVQAIESSPEKRLTLAQIYDWMVKTVPYFGAKGDSCSSAGWKNSVRHNLSLHNRFMRIANDSAGKSSWWVVNHDAKQSRNSRGRATTMDTKALEKKRGRNRKKVVSIKLEEVDSTTSYSPRPPPPYHYATSSSNLCRTSNLYSMYADHSTTSGSQPDPFDLRTTSNIFGSAVPIGSPHNMATSIEDGSHHYPSVATISACSSSSSSSTSSLLTVTSVQPMSALHGIENAARHLLSAENYDECVNEVDELNRCIAMGAVLSSRGGHERTLSESLAEMLVGEDLGDILTNDLSAMMSHSTTCRLPDASSFDKFTSVNQQLSGQVSLEWGQSSISAQNSCGQFSTTYPYRADYANASFHNSAIGLVTTDYGDVMSVDSFAAQQQRRHSDSLLMTSSGGGRRTLVHPSSGSDFSIGTLINGSANDHGSQLYPESTCPSGSETLARGIGTWFPQESRRDYAPCASRGRSLQGEARSSYVHGVHPRCICRCVCRNPTPTGEVASTTSLQRLSACRPSVYVDTPLPNGDAMHLMAAGVESNQVEDKSFVSSCRQSYDVGGRHH